METIFTCGEDGSCVYCMIFTCPCSIFSGELDGDYIYLW